MVSVVASSILAASVVGASGLPMSGGGHPLGRVARTGRGAADEQCEEHKKIGNVPASVDWADWMPPATSQGSCGSCHDFAAVAALEGASSVLLNKKVKLSEEQLIQCAGRDAGGCAGGDANYDILHYVNGPCACLESSYKYVDSNHTDESYDPEAPCTETSSSCHCGVEAGVVEGCGWVKKEGFSNAIEALKDAVSRQPLAIAIAWPESSNPDEPLPISAWGYPSYPGYQKDVLAPDELTTHACEHTNHNVALVGFGVQDGVEYWKIRNSWGTDWGLNGYFKMPVDKNGDKGPLCMYTDATMASYPIMKVPSPSPMPTPPAPSPAPRPTPSPVPAPTPLACKFIDPRYTMCCEHAGIAVVCAKGQTCGVLAGLPACLLSEEMIV